MHIGGGRERVLGCSRNVLTFSMPFFGSHKKSGPMLTSNHNPIHVGKIGANFLPLLNRKKQRSITSISSKGFLIEKFKHYPSLSHTHYRPSYLVADT